MTGSDWMTAKAACARLGIRAQTLYAYVSRGLLAVSAHPEDSRLGLYRASDVEALAARQKRSRKHADVAARAIAWGEPVLASAITSVRAGRLYYRGQDATVLSQDQTLEGVTELLAGMDCGPVEPSSRHTPPDDPDFLGRLFLALADRAASAPPLLGSSAEEQAGEAAILLQIVADAVSGMRGEGPIHTRLAQAWGSDPNGPAADLIRRMLVLTADHELNASTFTARVAASTGASLSASVLAGLTALSGPLHGGQGRIVQRFLTEAVEISNWQAVRNRLVEGLQLPGFGHLLYPEGDIRAKALLAELNLPEPFAKLCDTVREVTGAEPNIDFAMVAACSACGLPEDAPFAIFAMARSSGWIAHAIEQGQSRSLIRPRARYIGPEPGKISTD
ncbi:MAG: citrate synthase family protein [Novosphingobium sp.]|nr:citrate synthase family protein [Novosphingobium sp.]